MNIRMPDGSEVSFWRADRVAFSDSMWTLTQHDGSWVATLVPVPGLIVSDVGGKEDDGKEYEHSRHTGTELGLIAEVERLTKIINENNLKDLRAEKRAAKEKAKKSAAKKTDER